MDEINTTLQPTRPLVSTATPLPDTVSEGVQDYLAYRAKRGGIIHILSNFERLPEELENTWFEEDPKWQKPVALLQKRIISYIQPLSRHVHGGAPLRLEIHFTKEPPQFSPSPSAVVAVAAIDAKSGEAHHEVGRAEDLEHHPAAQSVPLGLTLACRSVEKGGDFWNMDYNQGGNMYRLEEVELKENAAWMAARNKYEGLGTPPFIGPAWPLPPLEGQKAMGIGVAAAGVLLGTRQQFGQQRANEPMLPHVHFAEAHAATEVQNNQKFFERQREDERRRTDAEFWQKKNETDKRMQEDARKNEEATAALAQSQVLEADLARLRGSPASMRDPALLAAVRGAEAKLAGMPGATPRTQIDIQTTNLDLADAARDALERGREVSMRAAEQTSKDSTEAAGVNAKNSTEAAAALSAMAFVAPAIGAAVVQTSFDEPAIAQGSVDYTGHIEPVNGPEDPGGGQAREGVPPIMQGSVDFQGRVQPVAGAIRSEEIDNVAGSTNVEGEVEPVTGEQGVRAEEPDVDAESGIADSGEPLPNIPARPQAAETTAEAANEAKDTRIAEQAQAIVEQEQARGEAPLPPAEAAVGGEKSGVEQNVADETGGSAVDQNAPGQAAVTAAGTSSAISEQPERPIEMATEPAFAPAERTLEHADTVERITGEPVVTGAVATAQEAAEAEPVAEREPGGEGAEAMPATATTRDAASLPEPEQPTQIQTVPASAPVDQTLEHADTVRRVVGEPSESGGTATAEAARPATAEAETSAAPARNEESETGENQPTGAGEAAAASAANAGTILADTGTIAPTGAETQSAAAVQQQAARPASVVGQPQQNVAGGRRDAASLPEPEQETGLQTTAASEAVDRTMENAESASHLVPEAVTPSSSAIAAQNQAAVTGTEHAASGAAQAVTPEHEITGQNAPTASAEAVQSAQPQTTTGQTPQEVVTISSETGEVVSQPANAGEKTFADVAAEASPPASNTAAVQNVADMAGENRSGSAQAMRPDQVDLAPTETDREMAERAQLQREETGDLGLGERGAQDRAKEHLAAAAFATPAAATGAAPAVAAQHTAATAAATPTATNNHGLAGPAIDRSNRRAPPATDRSQQAGVAANRNASARAVAGANVSRNAGLNGRAELGQRPLPPQAVGQAPAHHAPLEKRSAVRANSRQSQSSEQKQTRARKVVAKTAPASFDAIKPAVRKKAAATPLASAQSKRAAAPRRQQQPAKAMASTQPRGKQVPAARKASGLKKTVVGNRADSRRQKRQMPHTQAIQRRSRLPTPDIEPGPE